MARTHRSGPALLLSSLILLLAGLSLAATGPQVISVDRPQVVLTTTATGTGVIVGQVIDPGSGSGVPGAIVTLGGAAPPPPVPATRAGGPPTVYQPTVLRQITDNEGRFAFRNLPRGSYALTSQRPGYSDGAYGRLRAQGSTQQLQLGEGERVADVKIRMFRSAAIMGMVSEDNGDPAMNVTMRAYKRVALNGRMQLALIATTITDDRGIYRLASLLPGEYVISIATVLATTPTSLQLTGAAPPNLAATLQVSPFSSVPIGGGSIMSPNDRFVLLQTGLGQGIAPDSNGTLMVSPTVYYPSTTIASQAQPILVTSGEERAGIDLVLRRVPAVMVSGRLMGPDGPVPSWGLHLIPSDVGELSADPSAATTITEADGSFTFLAVPAGSYVLQTVRVPPYNPGSMATTGVVDPATGVRMVTTSTIQAQASMEPTLWAALPISVGGAGVRDVTVTLQRGLRISGRSEFDGASEKPPPARVSAMTVGAESADGRVRAAVTSARVEPSGQFTTMGYLPGRYVMRVNNVPGGWLLRSAMLGGVDVADMPLELDGRDLGGIVLMFTDRPGEIRGSVRDPQGRPDDSAAVALFPMDNRLWTNSGMTPRRMRLTRTTSSGTFTLPSLLPGEYGIVAFSEEFAGDWPDSRFVEQLSRAATRVTLGEGGKQAVDLARQPVRSMTMAWRASPREPDPVAIGGPFVDDASSGLDEQSRDVAPKTAAPPVSGSGTITGLVVSDDGTNRPIGRVRVSVRGADVRYDRTVATDDTGRFVMASLAPSAYTINASKASYLTSFYGAKPVTRAPGIAVPVAAGQRVDVVIKLARGGVLSGMVRDEFGGPAGNARVNITNFRVSGGQREFTSSQISNTDDRGIYRFWGLQSGSYIVSATSATNPSGELRQLSSDEWQQALSEVRAAAGRATAPGAMSTGVPPAGSAPPAPSRPSPALGRLVGYAPVYYPGTLSSSDATPVVVTTNQESNGVDFTLRLVPTARITGTVMGPDGRPSAGTNVSVFPAEASAGNFITTGVQPDGKFSSQYLPPGRYTVFARGTAGGAPPVSELVAIQRQIEAGVSVQNQLPGRQPLWAEATVELNGDDVNNLGLVLQEGMTISGRVVFSGVATPAEGGQVRISLGPARQNFRTNIPLPSTTADAAGNFSLTGVPPGQYRFNAAINVASLWMLKSAVIGGRDVMDLPLDIQPGQNIQGAAISFSDRMAELSGTIVDASGKPNFDLMIGLFPAERAYWSMTTGRRFRAATSPGPDGKYRFTGLPAGEYLLVAVTDVEPVDMGDPIVLDQLAAAAIKIAIADGEKKVQDIRLGR